MWERLILGLRAPQIVVGELRFCAGLNVGVLLRAFVSPWNR